MLYLQGNYAIINLPKERFTVDINNQYTTVVSPSIRMFFGFKKVDYWTWNGCSDRGLKMPHIESKSYLNYVNLTCFRTCHYNQ